MNDHVEIARETLAKTRARYLEEENKVWYGEARKHWVVGRIPDNLVGNKMRVRRGVANTIAKIADRFDPPPLFR